MEKNKDIQIELAKIQALRREVDLTASSQFKKGVTQKYARKNYDKPSAHKKFHDSQFGDKKVIIGSDGELLHRSQEAATRKYGSKRASYHQAQADHIDPIKNVYDRWKDNPLIDDADIKEAVNRVKNFQESSRHENASKRATSGVKEGIKNRDVKEAATGLRAQAETDILLTGQATKNAGKALAGITKNAGGEAVKAGEEAALVALVVSGVNNLAYVARGEKSIDEALVDIAEDTASSAVSASALKLTQEVVSGVANVAGADQIAGFMANGLPVAEVAAVAMTARYVKQYLDGDITGEDCAIQILISGAGALTYQLGMVIGGPAGAVVASIITTTITNTILEYRKENKISRARDAEISYVLAHAAREIEHQKNQLENYVKAELKHWDDTIGEGFQAIMQSIDIQDTNGISQGLNTILALLNTQVLYTSLADFDKDFYNLDAAPLEL